MQYLPLELLKIDLDDFRNLGLLFFGGIGSTREFFLTVENHKLAFKLFCTLSISNFIAECIGVCAV